MWVVLVANLRDLRFDIGAVLTQQQDTTAIRFDPFKNKFEDPMEKFINFSDSASGKCSPVDYLQVALNLIQPRVGRLFVIQLRNRPRSLERFDDL